MHGILRMVATLLLLTVLLLPGAQAMPLAAVPGGHAACHGHWPGAPPPVAPSYQCCVNGHHVAVPSVRFSLHLTVQVGTSNKDDVAGLASLPSVNSPVFVFHSSSPPAAAPLRI